MDALPSGRLQGSGLGRRVLGGRHARGDRYRRASHPLKSDPLASLGEEVDLVHFVLLVTLDDLDG